MGDLNQVNSWRFQDLQRTVAELTLELEDLRARLVDESSHRIAADQTAFGEQMKLRQTVDELLETILGGDALEDRGAWSQESSGRALPNQGPSYSPGTRTGSSQGPASLEDVGSAAFKAALLGLEASMSERIWQLCKDELASVDKGFAASLGQLEALVAEIGQSLADHLASHRLKEVAAPARGGALRQLEAHVAEMRVNAEKLHGGSLPRPGPCFAKPMALQAGEAPAVIYETRADAEKSSAAERPVVVVDDFVRLSQEQVEEELARFQHDKQMMAALVGGSDSPGGFEVGFEGGTASVASSAAVYSPSFCEASSTSADVLQLDAEEVEQARNDMQFLRGIMTQHQQTLQRGNR